jgi:hypothetical protein
MVTAKGIALTATPTPGQGAYRWHVQSLFLGRMQRDLELERYLTGLDEGGWAIVTVAPHKGGVLVIARKPRQHEKDTPQEDTP